MHYFRRMRTGSFDLMRGGVAAKRRNVSSSRKYRRISSNGYYLIYEPKHELAQNGGYVYEHRFVLFNAYGHDINSCEICGREWSWSSIYRSHVDHINNDRADNRIENLRPLCNSCNVKRSEADRHAASGRVPITLNGKTMTAAEWSRVDGCMVSQERIIYRVRAGVDHKNAVFSPPKAGPGVKKLREAGLKPCR